MKAQGRNCRRRDKSCPLIIALVLGCVAMASHGMAAADSPGTSRRGADMQPPPTAFDSLEVVSEEKLAALRGGLKLGGLDVQFGANIRALVDGTRVMETRIVFSETGMTQEVITAAGLQAGLESADIAALDETLPAESMSVHRLTLVGEAIGARAARDVLPPQIKLPQALANATGLVLRNDRGLVGSLTQVNRNQILSLLLVTGTHQQAEVQLDLLIDVNNFTEFQRLVEAISLTNRIGRAAAP